MKRSATDTTPTSPLCQTNKEEGRTALWRAVRSVVGSQRQAPPLQSVPRNGPMPLSFAQERLWLLHQLEPESPIYNKSIIQRLKGPLNVTALEQSLNEILRRHHVLRSTLPSQCLTPVQTGHFSMTDCRRFSDPETEARQRISEEIQKPFDLTRGPLLRTCLLRLDTEDHVLLLVTHQICFDDQSSGILIQELMALYEAFSKGEHSPLPELSVQYADFAHWQRQWFKGEVFEKQLAYWRKQLSVRVPRLNWSADRRGLGREASQPLEISTHLHESLRALSQREGVTLFVTLLAAFQTLLFRYTRQDNILVFSSIRGRNRAEIKGLIGLFTNLLALRTDLSGNPSFRELLCRVREVALGAYSHQDLPFDKLVEMLSSVTEQPHAPLFQVALVLQNTSMPSLSLSGLEAVPFRVDEEKPSQFDLVLYFKESAHGLGASLRYNTELFEAATIAEMRGHFRTLLEGIVADPDQQLSDLPCLTEAERQLLPIFGSQNLSNSNDLGETRRAPKDALEVQLVDIWKRVLRRDSVGVADNFFALGGHSLLALSLFAQIQRIFGKELPLATLFQAPTVEQLASILRQEVWSPPGSSLVAIQPGGSRRPFFCIHGCGADVLNYYDLANHLAPGQPFYALRAQGLDRGQVIHTRIEEMAAHYIKEIRTIQPEGPYFLGGGGGGGTIAFEMSQQLMAQDQKVPLLVLMDPAPARLNSLNLDPPSSRKSLSHYVRRAVYRLQHRQLSQTVKDTLKDALSDSLFNGVLKRWRIFHVFTPDRIRRLQRVRDAQMKALLDYVPQVYPDRITCFLREEFSGDPRKRIGDWYDLAAGGLDVRVITGNHGTMWKEPHVQVQAEQLKVCLDEAQMEG